MDLEDDAHMSNNNTDVVNLPVILNEEVLDAIADRVAKKIKFDSNTNLEEYVIGRIEYYFTDHFDINDYAGNIDFYDLKRGLIEDVIDCIKERL